MLGDSKSSLRKSGGLKYMACRKGSRDLPEDFANHFEWENLDEKHHGEQGCFKPPMPVEISATALFFRKGHSDTSSWSCNRSHIRESLLAPRIVCIIVLYLHWSWCNPSKENQKGHNWWAQRKKELLCQTNKPITHGIIALLCEDEASAPLPNNPLEIEGMERMEKEAEDVFNHGGLDDAWWFLLRSSEAQVGVGSRIMPGSALETMSSLPFFQVWNSYAHFLLLMHLVLIQVLGISSCQSQQWMCWSLWCGSSIWLCFVDCRGLCLCGHMNGTCPHWKTWSVPILLCFVRLSCNDGSGPWWEGRPWGTGGLSKDVLTTFLLSGTSWETIPKMRLDRGSINMSQPCPCTRFSLPSSRGRPRRRCGFMTTYFHHGFVMTIPNQSCNIFWLPWKWKIFVTMVIIDCQGVLINFIANHYTGVFARILPFQGRDSSSTRAVVVPLPGMGHSMKWHRNLRLGQSWTPITKRVKVKPSGRFEKWFAKGIWHMHTHAGMFSQGQDLYHQHRSGSTVWDQFLTERDCEKRGPSIKQRAATLATMNQENGGGAAYRIEELAGMKIFWRSRWTHLCKIPWFEYRISERVGNCTPGPNRDRQIAGRVGRGKPRRGTCVTAAIHGLQFFGTPARNHWLASMAQWLVSTETWCWRGPEFGTIWESRDPKRPWQILSETLCDKLDGKTKCLNIELNLFMKTWATMIRKSEWLPFHLPWERKVRKNQERDGFRPGN